MIRTTWMGGAIVAIIALASCGTGTPIASSPSPRTTSKGPASPSLSPSPSPSSSARFSSIRDALDYIQTKVDVPILLPARLPPGSRLVDKYPVDVTKYNGTRLVATLRLEFGDLGSLDIQYGAPTFAGCDAEFEHLVEVHVGSYPAVLGTSKNHSAIIWPATFKKSQGRYKLDGTFTGHEIIKLAESMKMVPGLEPRRPPSAC